MGKSRMAHYDNDRDFSRLQGIDSAMISLLHEIGSYGGYNSRTWIAFCQVGGLEISQKLGEYDDIHGTKHYWRLLKILDWGSDYAPRVYYGPTSKPFTALACELQRVKRIMDRYAQVLDRIDA